jgi:excisionase family DNA binding protein
MPRRKTGRTPAALHRQDIARATAGDARRLRRLDAALEGRADEPVRLILSSGEALALPEVLIHLMRRAVHHLARGREVAVVPYETLLTAQQAADLLNVSRPSLIRLLDEGRIPFEYVGTHRRIRLDDLLAYRRQRDLDRQRKLDELSRLNQELGLYRCP